MALLSMALWLVVQQSEIPAQPDDAAAARTERVRADIAHALQLKAFDLIDELVYGWLETPPFANATPVVLASMTPPMGTGTGLSAQLENHLAGLLVQYPRSNLTLVHCPACTEILVYSGRQGTQVSRGIDAPDALTRLAVLHPGTLALFVDFEAEGTALVLRARLTEMTPARRVVYGRTLSSRSDTAALLRSPDNLQSAAAARQEYIDILTQQESHLGWVGRINVRSYAAAEDANVRLAPYIWFETGVDVPFSEARVWLGNLTLGFSWAPQLHTAVAMGARVERLISARARALTYPDIYFFVGGSVMVTTGPDALFFKSGATPDPADLLAIATRTATSAVIGAWQLGLTLRAKERIHLSAFIEAAPGLGSVDNLGQYLNLGIVQFQTLGAEVGFCF